MTESVRDNEPEFDTSQWYAPFYGWLIFPALFSFFIFLGALIMVIFVRPSDLEGFELAIYSMDVFNLIFLSIAYFFWFRRKKLFPYLMVIFFGIMSIWFIIMYIYNMPFNYLNLIMSVVWIFYFLRSKRVKQTFVY